MPYRDILLALLVYPDATPAPAIDRAVRIARRLGGQVTALGVQTRVEAPKNILAEALVGLDRLAADERARSAALMREAFDRFQADARGIGLTAFNEIKLCRLHHEAEVVVAQARTHDVTITPLGSAPAALPLTHSLLFDSGRPVLVAPETGPLDAEAGPYARIAVAWDGSRPAARAVGDALPVLTQAEEVRLLTVLNDKAGVHAGCAHDLVRHLGQHGVRAIVDEVDGAGGHVAEAFEAYVADHDVELLVMGAYAHSRVREIILGGATAGVLARPFCPTLMSH